jgi:hypothetical protein
VLSAPSRGEQVAQARTNEGVFLEGKRHNAEIQTPAPQSTDAVLRDQTDQLMTGNKN